jgi:mannitol/fructose-specific phosphotransferase system IIA component (Ntr-type)
MDVAALLQPELIVTPMRAQSRIDAIRELVELLGSKGCVSDVESIVNLVWTREQERTTGIGEGLAVPHARVPGLTSVQIAVGRPEAGIDFNAFDKKPVQLVVLVLSPPDRTADHIQVLGWLSRRLADRCTRLAIYDATCATDMVDLLIAEPATS